MGSAAIITYPSVRDDDFATQRKRMKILITGHRGFVGSYLIEDPDCVPLADENGQPVNLLDLSGLDDAIARIRPDAVIHLAGQSFVPDAVRDPVATYNANFIGTQNLLAALRKSSFGGRFVFVSSADVYGVVPESELPILETREPRPLNPYAVSKRAAEMLCEYWCRAEGLDLVIARAFNHIGPRQSTRFAIADFARTISLIRLERQPPVLDVGDLDITRDFTDVRDVIAAYRLLLTQGQRGNIYNVCSGTERHLGGIVNDLAELAGVRITLRTDPARQRKVEQRRACGSSEKLQLHTGWQPRINWRDSLASTLHYWEQHCS